MDDRPLILAAGNGDREAFAALYDRYARPVFLDLLSRLRNRDDAEDVLQACFLAAWRSLPGLRRPERFVPWLFRIGRNRARDLFRRRAAAPSRIGAGEEFVAPESASDPESSEVRRLVASLKPRTRSVVLLRAVAGWSAGEVGDALGMSASSVRRHYARALEHLRDALTKEIAR